MLLGLRGDIPAGPQSLTNEEKEAQSNASHRSMVVPKINSLFKRKLVKGTSPFPSYYFFASVSLLINLLLQSAQLQHRYYVIHSDFFFIKDPL